MTAISEDPLGYFCPTCEQSTSGDSELHATVCPGKIELRGNPPISFKAWITRVNEECVKHVAMSSEDLPDWPVWDAWNSGWSSEEAAIDICLAAGIPEDIFDA